jgi:uncharacterized RDD family membrane protein YckC
VGQIPIQVGAPPLSYGPPAAYGPPGWGVLPLAPSPRYAPWGKRVVASLIDSVPNLLGTLLLSLGYVMLLVDLVAQQGQALTLSDLGAAPTVLVIGLIILLAALGWQIYNRWIVAGRTGQSLGKRVARIALVSEDSGRPIGSVNAFLRDLVHILDGFAYVGYLWPLWDERRQTFADKIVRPS